MLREAPGTWRPRIWIVKDAVCRPKKCSWRNWKNSKQYSWIAEERFCKHFYPGLAAWPVMVIYVGWLEQLLDRLPWSITSSRRSLHILWKISSSKIWIDAGFFFIVIVPRWVLMTLVIPWLFLFVGLSVRPSIWSRLKDLHNYWIAMKFCRDVHGPHKMNPTDFIL